MNPQVSMFSILRQPMKITGMRIAIQEKVTQNTSSLRNTVRFPSGVKKVTDEMRKPSTSPTHSIHSMRIPNRHQAATKKIPPMLPATAVRIRRTSYLIGVSLVIMI